MTKVTRVWRLMTITAVAGVLYHLTRTPRTMPQFAAHQCHHTPRSRTLPWTIGANCQYAPVASRKQDVLHQTLQMSNYSDALTTNGHQPLFHHIAAVAITKNIVKRDSISRTRWKRPRLCCGKLASSIH
ncbi:hypothetical protein EDD36DRAFT_22059 [Exophiala viscosa]|uniref:Uncharacterized protein n=1 Tax=Exophiala viscosa TaxID=2486360 RepID=A0AAN6E4S5_9EURO|nr:hypothetical protein EDD36DRAFT_22059 [Exophiala viscosa]